LLKSASVILAHPNGPVTEGGTPRPASCTAALIKKINPEIRLALSWRTMVFDRKGRCANGC